MRHCVVSNNSVVDSEGPDQSARMRRLICAFPDHISPKTCFRIARPMQTYQTYLEIRHNIRTVTNKSSAIELPRTYSGIISFKVALLPIPVYGSLSGSLFLSRKYNIT